jgi:hypothetical protein
MIAKVSKLHKTEAEIFAEARGSESRGAGRPLGAEPKKDKPARAPLSSARPIAGKGPGSPATAARYRHASRARKACAGAGAEFWVSFA